MKAAAFGLVFVLLVFPFAARSDENLVAKRETCRQEARLALSPKGKIGLDSFQRIVKRRVAHVSQCMARASVARKDAPLPTERAPAGLLNRHQAPAAVSALSEAAKAENSGRRKLNAASIISRKVRKTGRKQMRRLSRRSK